MAAYPAQKGRKYSEKMYRKQRSTTKVYFAIRSADSALPLERSGTRNRIQPHVTTPTDENCTQIRTLQINIFTIQASLLLQIMCDNKNLHNKQQEKCTQLRTTTM